MKKRVTSFLTAAIFTMLVLGTNAYGLSQDSDTYTSKLTKTQAQQIARDAIKKVTGKVLQDDKFDNRIDYTNSRNLYTWNISWNSYSDSNNVNAYVVIDDSTSDVTSISYNDFSGQNKVQNRVISETAAKSIAENIIKIMKPEAEGHIKYYPSAQMNVPTSSNYSYRYIRLINNIPYLSNSITIDINKSTGQVVNYSCSWDKDIDAPSLDSIISKDKADDILYGSRNFDLNYISIRDNYSQGQVKNIKTVYSISNDDYRVVDALTGELVKPDQEGFQGVQKNIDLTDDEKTSFLNAFKEMNKSSTEMTKETAEDRIKGYLKSITGKDFELTGTNYSEGQTGYPKQMVKTWSANFNIKNDTKPEDSGYISIDALTGRIINMSLNTISWGMGKVDPKLSYADGYKKAVDIVKNFYSDKLKNLSTMQRYTQDMGDKSSDDVSYWYSFPREENGIVYNENSIGISIDKRTGDIIGMSYYWDDSIKLPVPGKILPVDQIKKMYFDKFKTGLEYVAVSDTALKDSGKKTIKLVYDADITASSGYYFSSYDAYTGKILDYNGIDINKSDSVLSKISGKEKRQVVEVLLSKNIIDADTFNPGKRITKYEFIKMLVNTKNNGYGNYGERLKFTDIKSTDEKYQVIQLAVQYGIVDNKGVPFNPNRIITKTDIAYYTVKLLGFEKVAGARRIFANTYKDMTKIPAPLYGYVAIADGLGIVSPVNGEFHPDLQVNMLDAATSVYKALNYMKSN